MSNGNLSLKVDPFRLAEQAVSMHGVLQVKDMERLCSSLPSSEGEVAVDIQFGIDEQGIRFIRGHFETQIKLQCQRCMKSFDYKIINDLSVGIVVSEKAALQLPEHYDPVLAMNGVLMIQDMIEDELILSLPIVPMHDPKDCTATLSKLVAKSHEETDAEKENPFKVIELLKRKTEGKQD